MRGKGKRIKKVDGEKNNIKIHKERNKQKKRGGGRSKWGKRKENRIVEKEWEKVIWKEWEKVIWKEWEKVI